MLAIRMQRLGRKGHPTYRVVVQDVRQTPTSGKYVAMLGSYDPHTKANNLDKEKAEFYLNNGAQPSDRVVRLLSAEGVKLPSWVKQPSEHTRSIRNSDKLRRNRPAEKAPAEESTPPEAESSTEDVPAAEAPSEEAPAEEVAEAPAENASDESAESQVEAADPAPAEESKEEPAPAVEPETPAEQPAEDSEEKSEA